MSSVKNVTTKASKPKHAWFLQSSKMDGYYQVEIGYKDSRKNVGAFSSDPHYVVNKMPWGSPTSCDFLAIRKGHDLVKKFHFKNGNGEVAEFDIAVLNNLKGRLTPFSKKLTSMVAKQQYRLIARFVSIIQYSHGFILHDRDVHDKNGFRLDGTGLQLKDFEAEGGSYSSFMEFVKLAKESALNVDDEENPTCPKRKNAPSKAAPPLKVSRKEMIDTDEREELLDPQGLEQSFKKCYVGFTEIPLDNLEVHKDLLYLVDYDQVLKVADNMRSRYDPSQVNSCKTSLLTAQFS